MIRRTFRSAYMLLDNVRYAAGTGKPQLIWKLARNHMLVRLGRQIPRSLCLAVDYTCNMACEHCSARFLDNPSRPAMTLDQYRSVAEEAERLGFFNIQFTGGEPLLRKDLEEIISVFHPRRNLIMISTNATLLDEARIRSLKAAGVDVLSVSVDSRDAETHDSFRKMPGAWKKTVDAVTLAVRMGLGVSCSAVVTHQNIRSPDLEHLAVLFKSLGCGMQLNWACPVGAWAGNREVRLTEDDLRFLFDFEKRYCHARTDFDGNYKHRGCPAAKEMMYISARGDYLPCAFIPISYGNVTEEPLDVIRARCLQDPMYQRYWDRCLSASNDTFYEEYLQFTFGRRTPLPYGELARCRAKLHGTAATAESGEGGHGHEGAAHEREVPCSSACQSTKVPAVAAEPVLQR
jgi:MoaA/NifB/PqqE/SkfB family radical SAM enzyme